VSATSSKKKGSASPGKGGSRIVRSKGGGKGSKRAEAFLELLFPEVDERGGTAFADRKSRLRLAHKMERTIEYADETFDRIHEELDKDEASVEQREWDDRDERRRSDERARERAEDREDVRLGLEILEQGQVRAHKNVYLALAVAATATAIVLACVAVSQERAGFAGISLLNAVLSGVFFRLVRRPATASTATTAAVPDVQPWRWSVLDLQAEVEDGVPGQGDS
jgi:hypothetical protein